MSDAMDPLAFNVALGLLPKEERRDAEQRRLDDAEFDLAVRFWEEQLMSLHPTAPLAPKPDTWQKIAHKLQQAPAPPSRWFNYFWPGTALASLLIIALLSWRLFAPAPPNADYVAVLTDTQGQAKLTAMTTVQSKTIWLQWDKIDLSESQSLQIWAISRRDHEARSVAVLNDSQTTQLTLNEAASRLIVDAAELWLTVEERGGSALDMPSEQLLAKGVCVRLIKEKS